MGSDHFNLVDLTDKFLTREKFRAPRESHLRPSEASVRYFNEHGEQQTIGGCLRAAYFRITKSAQPTPDSARSELIFEMGKSCESMFREYWKQMGILVDSSVRFDIPEYGIQGELDAVLREPDGTLFGIEFKSCYGYQAEKEIFGNKWERGFPKMNQLLQTLVYTWKFRNQLPYFRMFYFTRDSVKRRTFKVELQEEGNLFYPKIEGQVLRQFTVNDIFNRYRLLMDLIQKKEVPPRDYELQFSPEKIELEFSRGNVAKTKYEKWKKGKLDKFEYIGEWQCRYCNYSQICYGPDISSSEEEGQTD